MRPRPAHRDHRLAARALLAACALLLTPPDAGAWQAAPSLARTEPAARTPAPTQPAPAALVPPARAEPATPDSLELLDATLWMQHAAERRALALQTFRLAGDRLREALADPSWTAVHEQRPGFEDLPPAVILDVDETVLDNHWYEARLVREQRSFESATWAEWCAEAAATPVPGALGFCREAARLGVQVFYVTNRREAQAEATRLNLARHGFPFADDLSHVLARTGASDKSPRRTQVALEHRVLLLVGDNGADFTSDLGRQASAERRELVDRNAPRWGRSWIVLPNPMYGDWQGALLDESDAPAGDALQARLVARLSPSPEPGDAAAPDVSAPPAQPGGPWARMASVVAELDTSQARVLPAATATTQHDVARAGPLRHPALASGPMAAWAGSTAACLWLQTTRPALAQVRSWPAGHAEQARLSEPVPTTDAGDRLATIVLDGLAPGSRTEYELFLDGERVATPWPLSVATHPLWEWRGPSAEQPHDPPALSLLVGSCNYVNDPPFDRPGQTYGGDHRIFEAMADEQADLMIWLGDNTYMRAEEWSSESSMRSRYAHTRALPELQRLLGTGSHLAIWDDHDYGPNDSDRSFALKQASLAVFRDYWPDQVYGLPETPGTFRRVSFADIDLFLLDDRFHRAPHDAPPGPDKGMLGAGQMAWLKDGLRSSRARFKLVLNGSQMLNPVAKYEGWADYPAERDELLAFVDAADIEGLVFVSGDRHATELMRIARPGRPDLYELTCSPLTAGTQDRDLDGEHAARVPGTWVNRHNYARIDVTGPGGARQLSVTVRDADGETIWTRTLP